MVLVDFAVLLYLNRGRRGKSSARHTNASVPVGKQQVIVQEYCLFTIRSQMVALA